MTDMGILAAARAIAAEDDGMFETPATVVEVAPTLQEALTRAAYTRRPVMVEVDGCPVCVYPAGTKPLAQSRDNG